MRTIAVIILLALGCETRTNALEGDWYPPGAQAVIGGTCLIDWSFRFYRRDREPQWALAATDGLEVIWFSTVELERTGSGFFVVLPDREEAAAPLLEVQELTAAHGVFRSFGFTPQLEGFPSDLTDPAGAVRVRNENECDIWTLLDPQVAAWRAGN